MLVGCIRLFDHLLVQVLGSQIRIVLPFDGMQHARDLKRRNTVGSFSGSNIAPHNAFVRSTTPSSPC